MSLIGVNFHSKVWLLHLCDVPLLPSMKIYVDIGVDIDVDIDIDVDVDIDVSIDIDI